MPLGAPRRAAVEHRSRDVGGEDSFEAGEVEIHEIFENAEASVIDENIEVAEFLEDFAVGALDVGFLGDVRVDCVHAQGAGGVREAAVVASGDGDARSAGRQRLGDGASDAAAAARDQRHRVSQVH